MVLDHVPMTLDFGCTCTVFGIAIAGRSLDFGYGCFSLDQEYRGAVIDEILLFDEVLLGLLRLRTALLAQPRAEAGEAERAGGLLDQAAALCRELQGVAAPSELSRLRRGIGIEIGGDG